MKNNKIQIVRTSGLIGILALGGLTGVMIFCPWGLDSKETELVRARQKAEVIAYQIESISFGLETHAVIIVAIGTAIKSLKEADIKSPLSLKLFGHFIVILEGTVV